MLTTRAAYAKLMSKCHNTRRHCINTEWLSIQRSPATGNIQPWPATGNTRRHCINTEWSSIQPWPATGNTLD